MRGALPPALSIILVIMLAALWRQMVTGMYLVERIIWANRSLLPSAMIEDQIPGLLWTAALILVQKIRMNRFGRRGLGPAGALSAKRYGSSVATAIPALASWLSTWWNGYFYRKQIFICQLSGTRKLSGSQMTILAMLDE